MVRSYNYFDCPNCKKKGAFMIKDIGLNIETGIWGKCKYCKCSISEKDWQKIELEGVKRK